MIDKPTVGSYTVTAADVTAKSIDFNIGFVPSYVEVINLTNASKAKVEANNLTTTHTGLKTKGTTSVTRVAAVPLSASAGIKLLNSATSGVGFNLGTVTTVDTDVLTASDVLTYKAYR